MKKLFLKQNDTYIQQKKLIFVLLIILIAIESLFLSMLVPNSLTSLIASLLDKDKQLLNSSVAPFLIITMSAGLLVFMSKILSNYLEKDLCVFLEKDFLFHHCKLQKLDGENHMSILRNTIPKIAESQMSLITSFFKNIFLIIVGSIYVITIEPIVLIVTVFITAVMIFIGKKKAQTSRELSQKFEQQNNNLYDATWEHIHNQEIIPFLNQEKVFRHYDECDEEFTTTLLKLKKNGNAVQSFAMIGTNILRVITILIGGYFSTLNIIDLADIYGLVLVVPIICTSLFNLPNLLFTYETLKGAQKILTEFYELPIYNGTDKMLLKEEIKTITLQIEQMGYMDKELLLKDVTYTIKQSDFITFVGKSGCGKSTLIKNISGLLDNYVGNIFINNTPLSTIERKSYWQHICYLDQKPRTFIGSIQQNIVLNAYNEARLAAAIKFADLEDVVSLLPDKLGTPITNLSSGEQQKVCFARAYYQDCSLWILDEATSALDPQSEENILRAIVNENFQDKIIIGISHRKQFMQAASKVLHINQQKIFLLKEDEVEAFVIEFQGDDYENK